MFYFLLRKSARYTVERLLAGHAKHLSHIVEPLFYEDLHLKPELRPGAFVFTDMDRILPPGNIAAARLHEYLSTFSSEFRVLNHPTKTLMRYDLLKKLYTLGINDFQICKASEDLSLLSMPVYLRSALGHNPILSGLLNDQKALRRAILEKRVLGHRPDTMYVIEFCDTSDERGIFTKYSALKIADQIFPRHVNFDTQWIVKSGAAHIDPDLHMSHRDHIDWYFSTNPHKEWLENVCNIAGIGYGRVDYSVLHGKPQLWEINTNPSYGRRSGARPSEAYLATNEPHKLAFYDGFLASLLSLASEPSHAMSISLIPVSKCITEIQKHLEIPEELMKDPPLLLKVANSKKRWVISAWKVLLEIYAVMTVLRRWAGSRI